MITLPEGFDPSVLAADFFTLAAPVVGVVALIAAGRWIMAALRGGR